MIIAQPLPATSRQHVVDAAPRRPPPHRRRSWGRRVSATLATVFVATGVLAISGVGLAIALEEQPLRG